MKALIKKVLYSTAQNEFGWKLLRASFVRIGDYAKWARAQKFVKDADVIIDNAVNTICPDLVVRHGPFKGMKYAGKKVFGGYLFPRLIGSYEREIAHIVEEACRQDYTDIVDVGCAEGYYAIGFALRLPNARIYAYDTDKEAVRVCGEMARLNNVEPRVKIGAFCSSETLKNIPFRGRGLIISDCEGYETTLFSEDIIPLLSDHDLLIELHDNVDINISSILRRRFENSHEITAIESIDDIKKAQVYNYEELRGYSLEDRKALLGEGRASIMQWFYMRSRKD